MQFAYFPTWGGGGGGSTGDDVAGHALGALDLDELIFVAIAVVSIFAGVVVCLYVVWTGPALLAEVLVDGMVMSGIYRKMKVVDPSYWISGVLRRTWLPVLLVAGFFAAAGFAMQKIDADAKSIGPVVAHVMGKVL